MEEKGLQKDQACLSLRALLAPQLALPERTQPGQAEATEVPELVVMAVGEETSRTVRHCIVGEAWRATQTRHCPHHSLGPLIQGCPGVRGDDWREKLKGNSVWSQVTA